LINKYKGRIYELRWIRNGFNLIHCSMVGKDRAEIMEVLPLPFDDEIQQTQKEDAVWMAEQYYLLQQQGVFKA
jgi:hypothetical protein